MYRHYKDVLYSRYPKDMMMKIFSNRVHLVEIEVFSFCNRKCWFCPNSIIDRHSVNYYMDEKIYLKILNDLRMIGYQGQISFSRFNEPFADPIIFKRIEQARENVPKAVLIANTNGDYLTRSNLDFLAQMGFGCLNVQVYPNQREEEDNAWNPQENISHIMDGLSIDLQLVRNEPGQWVEFAGSLGKMALRVYYRNFRKNGNYRGGTVAGINTRERVVPCLASVDSVYIDYNGKVMPCCNLRSDFSGHAAYVLGDVCNESKNLFSIYFSNEALNFRKNALKFGIKDGLCRFCSFRDGDFLQPQKR